MSFEKNSFLKINHIYILCKTWIFLLKKYENYVANNGYFLSISQFFLFILGQIKMISCIITKKRIK